MARSFARSLLSGVALLGIAALPVAAEATEFQIVLPTHFSGDADALTAAVGKAFAERVGPGDVFVVHDGTKDQRIAKISVPDDDRYKAGKRKFRKFEPEIAKIGAFLSGLSADPTSEDRLDILAVLHGIGDDRIQGKDEAIHAMIVGSPVQSLAEPEWSMVSEDRTLQVPTDAAMLSSTVRTPYSVSNRPQSLDTVYVHICGGGPELSPLNDMALRHVWGTWIAAQGGTLATWTDDLAVCVERVTATETTPVTVAQSDMTLPPAMMAPVWNEADRPGQVHRPQPKSFNVFFNERHPSVPGLFVTTGIEYAPELYPSEYNNAWCYFNSAAGQDAVHVRVSIATKRYGNKIVWRNPTDEELKAAGVSRSDAELARSACQFPEEAG